jgi:hypothetical protein
MFKYSQSLRFKCIQAMDSTLPGSQGFRKIIKAWRGPAKLGQIHRQLAARRSFSMKYTRRGFGLWSVLKTPAMRGYQTCPSGNLAGFLLSRQPRKVVIIPPSDGD